MNADPQALIAQLYAVIGAQAAVLEISYQTGFADGQASTREPEQRPALRLVRDGAS